MMKELKILLMTMLAFGLSQVVLAKADNPVKAIAVFDLSDITEDQIPKIYFSQKSEFIQPFIVEMGKAASEAKWDVINDYIKKFRELEVAESVRWISRKNQKISVYVFYKKDIKMSKISILEESRESRITGDLKNLIQSIPLTGKSKALKEVEFKEYVLKKSRGKLKISVSFSDASSEKANIQSGSPPSEKVSAPSGSAPTRELPKPLGQKKGDEEKESDAGLYIELITGSSEHFFLSADVPIFSIKDAEFANTKDKKLGIEPKETPKSFYLGVNFHFVDVMMESIIKPPYLKIMMQFSKTPFDSIGAGLGWNLPKLSFLSKLGFNTDSLCFFGGIFWAKESESKDLENKSRYQWRWGLSFDLSKISDWIKK